MLLRFVVTLSVMSLPLACTSSSIRPDMQSALKPLAGKLPPCEIDVPASEVNVQAAQGDYIGFQNGAVTSPYTADQLRNEVGEALGRLCAFGDGAKPARFRLRGSVEGSNMSMVATIVTGMNILWALFWLPTGGGDAELMLDYEYDGRVYSAKTAKSVTTGFWYNQMSADAAFVSGIDALAHDIAKQMGATP